MTSSPLLASVAESIVIFAPIDQVGCFSACSGVTADSSAFVASRNGPPEAVRMRAATSSMDSPTRHCQMAECSESIGRSHASGLAIRVARVRRRARRGERTGQRHDEVTAGDKRLLVGRGHDLPGPQSGEDRAKADDPAGADHHEIDVGTGREGLEGVGAADAFRVDRQVQAGEGIRIVKGDGCRPEPGRLLGEQRAIGTGRERDHAERVRVSGQDVDGLAADRSGRADQGDPTRLGRGPVPALSRRRRRHTA